MEKPASNKISDEIRVIIENHRAAGVPVSEIFTGVFGTAMLEAARQNVSSSDLIGLVMAHYQSVQVLAFVESFAESFGKSVEQFVSEAKDVLKKEEEKAAKKNSPFKGDQ